jgi:hypothetical protein
MKNRALIWDNIPGQGQNNRRGPIRNDVETDRLQRDKRYLERNAHELVKSEIINEKSDYWHQELPHDTIFHPDGRPQKPELYY